MRSSRIIWFMVFFLAAIAMQAQEGNELNDSLRFTGQLSLFGHYNPENSLQLWTGGRYIPQINYEVRLPDAKLLDFEVSANINGTFGFVPFDTSSADGNIKPYRIWTRYSGEQFELRLGLQKINFGSANILRPLMWFDQMDPRDPLQLTDGVWGALARYYFLNNTNIWLWALYGNKNPKGWELLKTSNNMPEFGGRIQTSVPAGELGISYHYREANNADSIVPVFNYTNIPEHRLGIDARFDRVLGYWLEASWIHKMKDLGLFTNQEILNLGVDYTLGIGNGVMLIFEQLMVSYSKEAFSFEDPVSFSLLNLSYPLGLFDNISAIVYYDWTNGSFYNFLNWQKQFNELTFFLMAYLNPRDYQIPTQSSAENLYAGAGVQLMFVYNH